MATIEENYEFWNEKYNWSRYRGDQWSALWGGPEAQWQWSVYPRIRQHLPADTILEIGPGQGRWTKFLKQYCQHLVVIDLSENCIRTCQERLGHDGMTYHVGDGRSLTALKDDSIDFAFSFESLIHTEIQDLSGYLNDLSNKLKKGATAFLHHSNLGSYTNYFQRIDRLPKSVQDFLKQRGFVDFDEWRASSVSYSGFETKALEAGLSVTSQELVPWGGRKLIDCFSTVKRGLSDKENRVFENRQFIRRAKEIKAFSRLYGPGSSWLAGD